MNDEGRVDNMNNESRDDRVRLIKWGWWDEVDTTRLAWWVGWDLVRSGHVWGHMWGSHDHGITLSLVKFNLTKKKKNQKNDSFLIY